MCIYTNTLSTYPQHIKPIECAGAHNLIFKVVRSFKIIQRVSVGRANVVLVT